MTAQFARAPHRGRPAGGTPIHEPHAALLIDFDNVTMGIRSDLTKELKNLLNSDIIKGKVAVQRAYADWRRYPQYIVPLAESSVDLIFAPAYGSAKKNATDIRLAIDAVELVFTRPEIGTIILLSGDSDFSSLVLKLKEYGKYVIGVGIRESASDLLVQNCDEYYSYSALTGLTRAGDEAPVVSEDPWELVELAIRQMVENDDVMRSDRLKQVLLELDPAFDEKALGFQKFNKFLQEAASRGMLVLRKQENGQYEVAVGTGEPTQAPSDTEARESRRGRGRRGRGGKRDEPRRDEQAADAGAGVESADAVAEDTAEPTVAAADTPADEAAAEAVQAAPRVDVPGAKRAEAPAKAAGTSDVAAERAKDRADRAAAKAARESERAAEAATPAATAAKTDLKAAYSLLRRATTDLVRKSGDSARDSDVKRRMLELEPGWDEAPLGFSKFSRFLRQAHDAEVVTLRKGDGGNYDVVPGNVELPAGEDERGGRRDRERSVREGSSREAQAPQPDRQPAAAAKPEKAPAAPPAGKPAAATTAAVPSPGPSAAIGFRRGSRGRAAPSGPPPLLEGQTAGIARPLSGGAPPAAAAPEQVDVPAAAKKDGRPAKKGRAPAKAAATTATRGAPKAGGRAPAKTAARAPAKKSAGAAPARFDAASLGLPREAGEIASYITSYPGVGPKSVQTLIDAFGAGKVFEALEAQPDRVREVIGGARGERLLEAWSDDVAARRAGQTPRAPAAAQAKADEQPAATARKSRGRRGGRRSGRARQATE